MAQPKPRPAPGGPGSIDPDFTPETAVATPQFSQRPSETPLEQLNRVLSTTIAGTARALRTVADDKARLDSKKEKAMNEQSRIMAVRASQEAQRAHSIQADRLHQAQRVGTDLALRANEHGLEWLERESRLRMTNAPSVEEREFWTEYFGNVVSGRKKQEVSDERIARRASANEFAVAGQTAENAMRAMSDLLKGDPLLQADLIGNGTGIHDRVQDWALKEAEAAAPELFDIAEDDPFFQQKEAQANAIRAQLIAQTMPVADRLMEAHATNMEQTAATTGTDLILSHMTNFFKGGETIEDMSDAINEVGSLHFTHLTKTQRTRKLKEIMVTGIDAALRGRFGSDITRLEPRLRELIEQAPFSQFQKAELDGVITDGLTGMAVDKFTALIGEARLSHTIEIPVTGPDGTVGIRSVPNPDAAFQMAVKGATGMTEYDMIATQTLIASGIADDPSKMTPTQLSAVAEILDKSRIMNNLGQAQRLKAAGRTRNFRAVFNGSPDGDPDAAYAIGFARRAFTADNVMEASQVRVLMEQEAIIRATDPMQADLSPGDEVWDGSSPIERTPETRALRQAVWEIEASFWNKPEVRRSAPLPENLKSELITNWTQGSPETMMDVLYFTKKLNMFRREEVFNALGRGSQATVALRNALHNQTLASNNMSFRSSPEDTMSAARQSMSLTDAKTFLDEATAFEDFEGRTNREIAAASFAEVFAVALKGDDRDSTGIFGGNLFNSKQAKEEIRENMSKINQAFMGPSKPNVDRMLNWWSDRVQKRTAQVGRENVNPIEEGYWVLEQMEAAGLILVNFDGETGFVGPDYKGHFGQHDPTGVKLTSRIQTYLDQPYAVWQREVIMEAMGIDAKHVPVTPRDIYHSIPGLVDTEILFRSDGERVDIRFQIFDGVHQDSQFIMRKTPADFGGVILQGVSEDGRIFDVPRAKHRVDYIGPDGREHTLMPGQPLSIFSDRLISESDIDLLGPIGRAAKRNITKAFPDLMRQSALEIFEDTGILTEILSIGQ